MEKENQDILYFLYARKSSESEDRQVQSIDDQLTKLKQLAKDLNLNIKTIFTEAKSAKKPNTRPLFDEMMQRIEAGEADGILCWQINRLSRNPIDSGKLSWLLQGNILKSIQTIDRQYLPDDNVLLFNVESGMANQYIIDLRKNTKRGVESKLAKGWLPNVAPLGYLNEKEEKIIIKDPERFNLIRKMWDLMLTGNYTPPMILKIANKDWGFRTRKFKRIGNNELSRSGIYKIFTNIFYAGIITHSGVQYEGKHDVMITLQEYDHVQLLLGRKGSPRLQKHIFAYTGMMRCGECDCLITAEKKTKLIKKTKTLKEYTYYHCTRRSSKSPCTQKKVLRVENLENQIEVELEKYTIFPEFLNWALEDIHKKANTKYQDKQKILESQKKALVTIQNELDELTKMRYRQLIDDVTFIREKYILQKKIFQINSNLQNADSQTEKFLELTEKTFTFAAYSHSAFLTAEGSIGLELKKEILAGIAKTLFIKDGKLIIEPTDWFSPIKYEYPTLKADFERLEPEINKMTTGQNDHFVSLCTRWLRIVDTIGTIIEKSEGNIYIPDLRPKEIPDSKAV